ncbi:hypothetical protein A3B46_00465 [Candidatus Roizmanbacteria bacterium RIFCSPLOWO2_01_FULL_39_19]|nr:MAG: hypothetical protein A3B46_00465 [Candidatus Roizmanbacteria bacterium RIFCSPLOWO2_01_FULL_39_19]
MTILLIVLALLLTPKIYAQSQVNVETRVESNSNVEVNTSVKRDSSTYRKVEIDVNGEKQTFESNEPGSDSIKVESKNGKTTVIKTKNNQINVSITPINSPTYDIEKNINKEFDKIPQTSLSQYIINWIKDLFKKIF